MKNEPKICQVLTQTTRANLVAKQHGLDGSFSHLILALYEDQTWEYLAAFLGSTYDYVERGGTRPPHLARLLQNKTRSEARAIIMAYFEKLNINGKLFQAEEPT